MTLAIRATKLYLPRQRAKEIRRERLVEHLDEGLERELTLVAAPARLGDAPPDDGRRGSRVGPKGRR